MSKKSCFAIVVLLKRVYKFGFTARDQPGLNDREDIAFTHEKIFPVDLNLSTGILAVQYSVAGFYGYGFVSFLPGPARDNRAAGVFFSGVGMMIPPAVFSSAGPLSQLPGRAKVTFTFLAIIVLIFEFRF